MAIYFKDKEITNIDSLIPQTGLDITDIWFGNTNVYTVWQVYESTLPATLNANGDGMRQYQVYGATGGVGDRTVQLFDKNATDTDKGYVSGAYIKSDGELQNSSTWFVSEYIPVNAEKQYTVVYGSIASSRAVCYYDINKNYISGANYSGLSAQETITTPSTCAYMRLSLVLDAKDTITVTLGTTPPENYVPYGYEVDIGVKSANVMPSAPAETKTSNGITVICDGEGRYSISGRNTENFEISFDIQEFTIPTSIEWGGAGTLSFFNDFISNNLYIVFRFDATFIGSFSFDRLNRVNTSYQQIGGKKANRIILKNNNGTTISPNGNFNLMFTDNDVLPAKYQPYFNVTTPIYIGDDPLDKDEYIDYQAGKIYRMINGVLTPTDPPVPLPALPTCEGATIVDYTGSGTAPEKVLLKYRKEGF